MNQDEAAVATSQTEEGNFEVPKKDPEFGETEFSLRKAKLRAVKNCSMLSGVPNRLSKNTSLSKTTY